MNEEQSEFGKGLCYCLGLFLAHTERFKGDVEAYQSIGVPDYAAEMWFNAASDHLYELQVENAPNAEIRVRLITLKDKSLDWGHGFEPVNKATKADVSWAIQEAKDLLRLIDEAQGVPTEKGRWE
jgi:hypothetical protein